MKKLSHQEIMKFMDEMCAPWVKMLNLSINEVRR